MAQAQLTKLSLETTDTDHLQLVDQQGGLRRVRQLQGKLVCEAYPGYCLVPGCGGLEFVITKLDNTQEWRFTRNTDGTYFIGYPTGCGCTEYLNHEGKKVVVKETPMGWNLDKCTVGGFEFFIVPVGFPMIDVDAVNKKALELKCKRDINDQKWAIMKVIAI